MQNSKSIVWLLTFLILCLFLLPSCGGGGGGGGGGFLPPAPDENGLEAGIPLPPAGQPLNAGNPEGPPPPSPGRFIEAPLSRQTRDTMNCDLSQGWTTLSFPFDNLTSTSGFTYYLYFWNGSQYQTVDPNNAAAIDCTKAYWAYCSDAATVSADGNYGGNITEAALSSGWNFFPYPQRVSRNFSTLTLTYNGQTKLLKNAASYETTRDNSWAYARIYHYCDNTWYQMRCDNDANQLACYCGYWIWSWEDNLTLNFTRTAVNSINPATGPVGIPVTILGANFSTPQGTSTIKFNGVSAGAALSWSNTRIVCLVPAGSVSGAVIVNTRNGESNSEITFTLTPPQITSLQPSSGCGVTTVTINGSSFGLEQGVSTISFNGVEVGAATSWCNTQIICTIPITVSTGPVVINTLSGQSNTNVIFTVPAPQISSLQPASGLVGAQVTLTGSNFATSKGTSTVSFNGTTAGSVASWCNTQIVCSVPTGATTGAVVVTTSAGNSNSDLIFTLEVPPALPPSVDSITPTGGGAETAVTISGFNFGTTQGAGTVSFNGIDAGTATGWCNTRIICNAPSGAASGAVVVTVNGQASNNDITFTFSVSESVSGLVRDENGIGIVGATVDIAQRSREIRAERSPQTTTDANGRFSLTNISYSNFALQITKSGKKTVTVDGFTAGGDYSSLSVTQPAGSGSLNIALPDPITLNVTALGCNANLTWDQSQSSDFNAYLLMRSSSSGIDVLNNNVGKFTGVSTTSMTDRNLTTGTWYYRLFQVVNTDSGPLALGSNEVSLAPATAFPPLIAFLMMKTLPVSGGGFEHQARYVATTTNIAGTIPSGKTVTVTAPVFSPSQTTTAGYTPDAGYKDVKNYYYGNPAHYLGEIHLPGEWKSKYFASMDNYPAANRIGDHSITIDANTISLATFTTDQKSNKIVNPVLTRNGNGELELSWTMIQDGVSFGGGAGNYGWKYFVKVMYEGIYEGGADPTYQYEKYWSNVCIKDLGFNQICDRVVNMPLDTANKLIIPNGIFSAGDTVTICLYAISTNESFNTPSSGLSGYGKAYMYWLFQPGVDQTVP